MENKEFIALVLILIGISGGTIAACVSQRVRDLFFLGVILLAPTTESYDVNFVSRDWYRGTVRGFEFSLLDILSISLLVAMVLIPRRGEKRLYWPGALGLMLLYFLYCVLNVGLSDPKLWGLFELSKMARGLILFGAVALFMRGERELKLFLFALSVAVLYQAFLALEQRYRFGIHRVFGTLTEANSLSVFFCTTVPILVAGFNSGNIPKWLKGLCLAAIGAACVGEVLTISRAGLVAFAFVLTGATLMTMSYRITFRKLALACLVMIGFAVIAGKSYKTLAARFAESTLQQEYGNKRNLGRGYYIRIATTIAAERPLGVGLNNWSYWVSNDYGPRLGYRFVPYKGTRVIPSEIVPEDSNIDMAQAAPAHNLLALTLGELGVPGFVLLLLLWARWFQMSGSFLFRRTPDPLHRVGIGIFFGLLGMFLQSQTEWVFRQSPLHFTVHIMFGTLACLYYRKKHSFAPAALRAESDEAEEPEWIAPPGISPLPTR